MQYFFINKNSELPTLRLEIINDGKNDFYKYYSAIQNADVTFTMTNQETGIKKIANATAQVTQDINYQCGEHYFLEYFWKKRDTNESGIFNGEFTIKFMNDIYMDGVSFPKGTLIVPIADTLQITINDSGIKR